MRKRSALESAARQLLRLFPGSPMAERAMLILREINAPADRCREKGCVFPALAGHDLCRGHLVDLSAQF